MHLQDFKDQLAKDAFGITQSEAEEKLICISCREPAMSKCYSDLGRREYFISGMCEECFDELFREK